MDSTRQNKVSRLVQKELSDIFQKTGQDIFQGSIITVTTVRISADLSLARVYLSIFSTRDTSKLFTKINESKNKIRYELGKRVRNQLRIVPQLVFFIDDSLDYMENIENLLK